MSRNGFARLWIVFSAERICSIWTSFLYFRNTAGNNCFRKLTGGSCRKGAKGCVRPWGFHQKLPHCYSNTGSWVGRRVVWTNFSTTVCEVIPVSEKTTSNMLWTYVLIINCIHRICIYIYCRMSEIDLIDIFSSHLTSKWGLKVPKLVVQRRSTGCKSLHRGGIVQASRNLHLS